MRIIVQLSALLWSTVFATESIGAELCPDKWRKNYSGDECYRTNTDGQFAFAALMQTSKDGFFVGPFVTRDEPVEIHKYQVSQGFESAGYKLVFMYDTADGTVTSPGLKSGDTLKQLKFDNGVSCSYYRRRCKGEVWTATGYYYGDLSRSYDGGPLTPSGKGIQIDEEGTVQIGTFVKGQLEGKDVRVIFLDGAEYRGALAGGKKNGYGSYYYPSGTIYKGSWTRDYQDGSGAAFYADGSVWSGRWYSGEKREGKSFASKALYERELRAVALTKDEKRKRIASAISSLQKNLIALGLLESGSADGIAGAKTKAATKTVLSWFPSQSIILPDWAKAEQIELTSDFILDSRRGSVGTCSNAGKYANSLCFE